jgi:hypothetical protein
MTVISQENVCKFLNNVAEFFLEWEIFSDKFVEKLKTHFLFNNIFPKIMLFVS